MELRLIEVMSRAQGNIAYEEAKAGFELRSLAPELLIFPSHHRAEGLTLLCVCLSCRPRGVGELGVAGSCSEVFVL